MGHTYRLRDRNMFVFLAIAQLVHTLATEPGCPPKRDDGQCDPVPTNTIEYQIAFNDPSDCRTDKCPDTLSGGSRKI